MTEDRTFLDPLNDAENILRMIEARLDKIAAALRVAGNPVLGSTLEVTADDIAAAARFVAEGRNIALNNMLGVAEASTTNMVRAALAVANRAPLNAEH